MKVIYILIAIISLLLSYGCEDKSGVTLSSSNRDDLRDYSTDGFTHARVGYSVNCWRVGEGHTYTIIPNRYHLCGFIPVVDVGKKEYIDGVMYAGSLDEVAEKFKELPEQTYIVINGYPQLKIVGVGEIVLIPEDEVQSLKKQILDDYPNLLVYKW